MKKIKGDYIFIIVLLSIGIVYLVNFFYEVQLFRKQWQDPFYHKIEIPGEFIELHSGARTNPYFVFSYSFNGTEYTNHHKISYEIYGECEDTLRALIGKKVIVSLIEENPQNSRLLLEEDYFKKRCN